jgi:hypothetical protein
MSWPLTILVGLLTAVAGCVGAGYLATLCIDWYRISSREGESGYFIVLMGFLGIAGGLAIGIVCSRMVAKGADPGFFRALGLSLGATLGLLAAIAGLCWLGADIPPKIDGKELDIEVEVRFPAGHARPVQEEAKDGGSRDWHVTITADHGKRRQSRGPLRPADAFQAEGRWVVPGELDLSTSDQGKAIGLSVGREMPQYFDLPLPGHPSRKHLEWSPWLTKQFNGSRAPIPAEEMVEVRYRVKLHVPPPPPPPSPPVPNREEAEAAEEVKQKAAFDALTAQSPVSDWLAFTHYAQPQGRRELAANSIASRPNVVKELSALILSTSPETADLALRAVSAMSAPPAGLAPAVEAFGRDLAARIRDVNATPVADDPSYEKAAAVSVRFVGWTGACVAMHEKAGVDQLPILREIQALSRVRDDSYVMKVDVSRVADFYVTKWDGAAPRLTSP